MPGRVSSPDRPGRVLVARPDEVMIETIGLDEVTEEIGPLDLTLMWELIDWDCLGG